MFAKSGRKVVSRWHHPWVRREERKAVSCLVCGGDKDQEARAPLALVGAHQVLLGLEDSLFLLFGCSRRSWPHLSQRWGVFSGLLWGSPGQRSGLQGPQRPCSAAEHCPHHPPSGGTQPLSLQELTNFGWPAGHSPRVVEALTVSQSPISSWRSSEHLFFLLPGMSPASRIPQ